MTLLPFVSKTRQEFGGEGCLASKEVCESLVIGRERLLVMRLCLSVGNK